MPKRVDDLTPGDVVVGPWGRYELRVTELLPDHVFGVYTKVPPNGYDLGSVCCYMRKDWKGGMAELATPDPRSAPP